MLPDCTILLIDSLPMVRETLRPDGNAATAGIRIQIASSYPEAVEAAARNRADRPAAVIVPLVEWQGLQPADACTALLAASPDLLVVLTGLQIPAAWQKWVASHPQSHRLLTMPHPPDLHLLRVLGGWITAARNPAGLLLSVLPGVPPTPSQAVVTELQQSQERFATAFRSSPVAQAILNFQTGRFVEANPAFCSLTGFDPPDLREHSMAVLQSTGLLPALQEPHPISGFSAPLRRRSGDLRQASLTTQPVTFGGIPHLLVMAEDQTPILHLTDQLRQSQRMEAMGQLAAGVAHDFNNILTIIQGQLSLQLDTADFPTDVRHALRESLAASAHAATLARQLLALSHPHHFERVPTDLNGVVERMSTLLQRLIGESIDLEWKCGSTLPQVSGDAPSLEQVILHLVLFARDAMPRGGRLRITTGLAEISPAKAAQHPESREGTFVRFGIMDSGTGMDATRVTRLSEVFASSQTAPRDTGTPLAAVHSIVRQHQGWMELFSAPAEGTAIFVYLPVAAPADPAKLPLPAKLRAMGLTVLLVEDDPAVRTVSKQLLIHCGCTVLEAADAPAALRVWAEHQSRIQLLITDIVLPGGMNGHELADRLSSENPALRIIYSSGYSADVFQQGQSLVAGRNFLPKPYDAASVVSLITRVAESGPEVLPS